MLLERGLVDRLGVAMHICCTAWLMYCCMAPPSAARMAACSCCLGLGWVRSAVPACEQVQLQCQVAASSCRIQQHTLELIQ